MAPIRRYDAKPNMASLYARTVAATLRQAARDASDEQVTLELSGVRIDPDQLASYREVTGFADDTVLPITYPHVLAFPLHLDLMSDPAFPHKPMGMVHLGNSITQEQPIPVDAELEISVSAGPERAHPKGTVFDINSEARIDGTAVWHDQTTLLSRGPGTPDASTDVLPDPELDATAEWDLRGNLGRRYAAVSGDRNPIHLFKLSAQAFGFPRQIAHGMWAKAACLAAIGDLPPACAVRVDFRKPIPLPSKVQFAHQATGFALYSPGQTHLIGQLTPANPRD